MLHVQLHIPPFGAVLGSKAQLPPQQASSPQLNPALAAASCLLEVPLRGGLSVSGTHVKSQETNLVRLCFQTSPKQFKSIYIAAGRRGGSVGKVLEGLVT